ncbi:MAG: lipoprotein [Cycloclasticus sp.]|nr:lipoprotein [Cycloclasticus sp.]
MRFLKVMMILGLLIVAAGCGQKGDLYMPSSQQVTQFVGQ